jgi:hypothetical protein
MRRHDHLGMVGGVRTVAGLQAVYLLATSGRCISDDVMSRGKLREESHKHQRRIVGAAIMSDSAKRFRPSGYMSGTHPIGAVRGITARRSGNADGKIASSSPVFLTNGSVQITFTPARKAFLPHAGATIAALANKHRSGLESGETVQHEETVGGAM